MTTKKAIKNMVDLINEKYQFVDGKEEYFINANRLLNGWEITLGPKNHHAIVLTQYNEITSDMCMMVLKMLFHDILERQNLNHYKVSRRV